MKGSQFSDEQKAVILKQGTDGGPVAEICRRAEIGYPRTIRVDNGREFVSRNLDLWANVHGAMLDFSRPGKRTDNAFIESFNGKFRAECLNAHWFLSLDDARAKMEEWRRNFNESAHTAPSGTNPRYRS